MNFASTEANLIKTEQGGKLVVTGTNKDVKGAFNVELDMVSVVKNGDAYTITPIDMTGVDPKNFRARTRFIAINRLLQTASRDMTCIFS